MLKLRHLLILPVVFGVFCSLPASALSEWQRGTISQYCGTIRQTLQTVQRNDSRLRTRLGSYYETIYSDFMVPLNLRLVKNNQQSTTTLAQQSNFATARTEFSSNFINYSRSLEELIAYDCQSDPDGFYAKLTDVRAKRELVHSSVTSLNQIIAEHSSSVAEIGGSL